MRVFNEHLKDKNKPLITYEEATKEQYKNGNILKQLKDKYEEWLKYESSYMTEDKQLVVEMMNRLNTHLQDKSIPILTLAEIKEELSKDRKYK